MYFVCLFPDSHIFSYHNYCHPTSLAFQLFWVSHYCRYCLFIYLFIYCCILVNCSCTQSQQTNTDLCGLSTAEQGSEMSNSSHGLRKLISQVLTKKLNGTEEGLSQQPISRLQRSLSHPNSLHTTTTMIPTVNAALNMGIGQENSQIVHWKVP